MTDIFISYSRQNTDFVRHLYESLDRSGRDVWIDWESIPRGEEFLKTIYDGIDAADVFLFIVSRHALTSEICNLEVRHARRRQKKIIPVMIELIEGDVFNAVIAGWYKKAWESDARDNWDVLKAINWSIFTPDRDFETEFKALTQEIDTDRPHVRLHTRYGIAAKDWDSAGRAASLLLIGDQAAAAEKWLHESTAENKTPAPTDQMRMYIIESRSAESERIRLALEQERRTRRLTISTIVFIIMAILLAVIGVTALQSRQLSIEQANIARTEQGQAIAARETAINDADIARTAEAQALEQQDIARVGAAANLDLLEHRDALALERMNRAVERYPQSASVYFFRGLVLSTLGQTTRAIADYDTAIQLDPTIAEVYNNRGLARFRSGDNTGAIADFDTAIQLNPDYVEAYSNRGAVKADDGDYDGAIQDYDRAIRLDPTNAAAYYNRANARTASGDQAGALSDFDTAVRLNPSDADIHLGRGYARSAVGDYNGAIADFDAALRLNPNSATAYNNRGVARAALEDHDGAIADFDAAIRLDPAYADAYYNRGNTRSTLGDNAGAIADYDAVIDINPESFEAYYNRARSKFLIEDYAGALTDYDAAIRLRPDYAQAYSDRGIVHFYLGQNAPRRAIQNTEYQAAVSDWDRAEQLGLDLPSAIQVTRDQLRALLVTRAPQTSDPVGTKTPPPEVTTAP